MAISQAFAFHTRVNRTRDKLSNKDSYLSYMPASSSFEQTLLFISVLYGVKIGFSLPEEIDKNMKVLNPSIFMTD